MSNKPAIKTMFVWSSKALKSVDCRIVDITPAQQDVTSAKYTRTLVTDGLKIAVIGTGDVLSAQTLRELAQAFCKGKFTISRTGVSHYAI